MSLGCTCENEGHQMCHQNDVRSTMKTPVRKTLTYDEKLRETKCMQMVSDGMSRSKHAIPTT